MRVGEALRWGILAGLLLASAGGCSGIDVPHGEDGRAEGARGGSTPIGGAGGGAGTSVGGTSGAGGSITITGPPYECPDCPVASYGVTVRGDASDLELLFNAPTPEPMCASQTLLGTLGGCGGGIYFDVCEAPNGEGACLELAGRSALYTDRSGRIWTGTLAALSGNDQIPNTDTGSLSLNLEADGDTLYLEVDYLLCSVGYVVRIPC